MVDAGITKWRGLDILVNNSAIQYNRFFDEYSDELFSRLWNVNVGGCFRVTRECIKYLKLSENPRVINIASIHAKRPMVADVGYTASKGAIRMFSREAALELGTKYGIKVNTIYLGSCRVDGRTQTDDTMGWRTGRVAEKKRSDTVTPHPHANRMTTPRDVGNLALFLASPDAEMLNGSGIRIDNGGNMG
jgi:glucose 1-dehydrogenase